MIVAYDGFPKDRIFCRIVYSSWEQATSSIWNQDRGYHSLHDTDKGRRPIDDAWDNWEPFNPEEARPVPKNNGA